MVGSGRRSTVAGRIAEEQPQAVEETFSEEEAAKLLGLSRRQLRRRRSARKIEAFKDGISVRYTTKQLANYQQSTRINGASDEKIDSQRLLRELRSKLLSKE